MPRVKQAYHQIPIRVSLELLDVLQKRAEKNGRSFSKEVVHLVEAQLAQEQKEKDAIATGILER